MGLLAFSTYFNSIKVRLEREHQPSADFDALFQFHKGTIRTYGKNMYKYFIANFNSIKVRLERRKTNTFRLPVLFQFHKGTIRTTYRDSCLPVVNIKFQFHKGTIRTV